VSARKHAWNAYHEGGEPASVERAVISDFLSVLDERLGELEELLRETDELVRIFAASIRTARSNAKENGRCREEAGTYCE
jgi:hypothetical protein